MKLITGGWSNPDGTVVANGKLFLKLSRDAVTIGGTPLSISSIAPVSIQLDVNGLIPAGTQIWATDELTPATTYVLSVVAAGGGLVWKSGRTSLTGTSPININNVVPS